MTHCTRRHTAQVARAAPAAEEQPQEGQHAALRGDIVLMLRQLLEGQAEQTRLIIATRTELRAMQQELTTLRSLMDTVRHTQINQESRQQQIDLEHSRIWADCEQVKRRLDRCVGQLDDIHNKICRHVPNQDPPLVDPSTLLLPAPSDPPSESL